MAESTITTGTTLDALAIAALQDASGATGDAIRLLQGWLLNNAELLDEHLPELLDLACARKVSWVQSSVRRVLETRDMPAVSAPSQELLQGYIDSTMAGLTSLLDWPLSDGTKLRHARRPALLHNVNAYGRRITRMQYRKHWLTAIMNALPDETTPVGQVLSEDQVRALYVAAQP